MHKPIQCKERKKAEYLRVDWISKVVVSIDSAACCSYTAEDSDVRHLYLFKSLSFTLAKCLISRKEKLSYS